MGIISDDVVERDHTTVTSVERYLHKKVISGSI